MIFMTFHSVGKIDSYFSEGLKPPSRLNLIKTRFNMAKSTSSIVKSLPSMLKNLCFLVGFSSIQPQIVPCSTGADEKCKSCKGIRDRQAGWYSHMLHV